MFLIQNYYRYEATIKPFAALKEEYNFLYKKFSKSGSPVVYAHNDLLIGNILYDEKKNSVTFIDFEYTAYNYQAFDIANHFAEFAGEIFIFFLYYSIFY